MSDSVTTSPMLRTEREAIAVLASAVSLRMIGLFMLLPVIAIYAEGMTGSTPFLIGVAVGGYGLTQAMFQIPLGMLSDVIGRKPVIVGGLMVFAAGSWLAGVANEIHWLIAGRLLQGAGAVAAASSALAADLTRESQRTKAMAIVGVSIGASFMLAIVIGPALASVIEVSGLLIVCGAMGAAAAILVAGKIPNQDFLSVKHSSWSLGTLLQGDLVRLNVGVFALHAALTSIFVALPQQLKLKAVELSSEWMVYLSALLLSFVILVPLLWKIDRTRGVKRIYLLSTIGLLLGLLLLWKSGSLVGLWLGLAVFFAGFNFLEASMPSLVSKKAPEASRGAAMGGFSTAQFLGIFAGGVIAGSVYGAYGTNAVYVSCIVFVGVWLGLIFIAPSSGFEA